MKSFVYQDFQIEVKEEAAGSIRMKWLGSCLFNDPGKVFVPFLKESIGELKGHKFLLDFSELTLFNSTTVRPVLEYFKDLEEAQIETHVIYDKARTWQRASFEPINIMINHFTYVKIMSK